MELAHANRVATMGQLSASIAHEVSQPIAGTITNARAALRLLDTEPLNVDGFRRALERIVRDGNRAGEVVVRILGGALFELAQLSRERAGVKPMENGERTQAYMAQAIVALSDASLYPAPMAFQLKDFKQVQASVFQVTRSPGKTIVYLGCAFLILGVFAMLYVRERRLWVWLAPSDNGSQASMALSSNRETMDVDREFERLRHQLLGSP